MGRERKEPSIEERRSVVLEAFKMATDAQKKRNELINDIMFDFYCYMSDANTPNDAIKCFGDAYRKLYVKCVPCSTVDIIVKFTLAKFKANGWMHKECDDWDSGQAHLIIEAFKFAEEKSDDERFTTVFVLKYLEDPHLSDSVRLYGWKLFRHL